MTERYYRQCLRCTRRVHMNFYCDNCGGDPWGIKKKKEEALTNLEAKELQLVQTLGETCEAIKKLREDIATMDQKRTEFDAANKH